MPPEQCPECDRFLRQSFLTGLADAVAPCPRCGTELSLERLGAGHTAAEPDPAERTAAPAGDDDGPPPPPLFAEASGRPAVAADEDANPVAAPATSVRTPDLALDGDTSVRPPDLRPDTVRGPDDPLVGWDVGVPIGTAAVRDERPFPLDTVIVAGAGVVGAGLGAVFGARPVRDASLGALGAIVGAGVVRRLWQLP